MKIAENLHVFVDKNPKIWITIKTTMTASPPAFLGYTALRLSSDPTKIMPFQVELRDYFLAHPILTFFLLLWPAIAALLFTIADHAVAKIKEKLIYPRVLCSSLLAALDDLVGSKLRRFEEYVKGMKSDEPRCKVFETITQPQLQIKTFVKNVHHVLEKTTDDNSIQLVLAKMKDNIPFEWSEVAPNHIQLPASLLQNDGQKTLFYDVARQRKILCIPDIELYIRKKKKKPLFCPVGNTDVDKGSIICYPVIHQATNAVVYVISIKSDIPRAITDDFKKTFRPVMDAFITRLLMEYNLFYIKERSLPCQRR